MEGCTTHNRSENCEVSVHDDLGAESRQSKTSESISPQGLDSESQTAVTGTHMPMEGKTLAKRMQIRNKMVRECIAEMLGTFILMLFGNGAVAQTVLSHGADGDYLTIYWGYAVGVTMGVYVAAGVSGAHLNPAVSLAMCVTKRLPWIKLPPYAAAQLVGAFLSAPVVYGIYYDALNAYDGGVRQVLGPNGTASIFATYPKEYLSIINGLFDQIFGTALLLCGIFAINDSKNSKPPSGMEPFLVGMLVFALGNAYGTNCGYAINPARDLGPRLFTLMAGWGSEVFTAPNGMNWSWVPIVGPLTGGVLGALVYMLVIEIHWPEMPTKDTEKKSSPEEVNIANPHAETLFVLQEQKF